MHIPILSYIRGNGYAYAFMTIVLAEDPFDALASKGYCDGKMIEWSAHRGYSGRPGGRARGVACYMAGLEQRTRGDAEFAKHAALIEALCRIVDTIQCAGRQCAVDGTGLQQMVGAYLKAYKAVYGAQEMTIKLHYLHHIAPQLARWSRKCYPNCFVLERKHKSVKAIADHAHNVRDDRSLTWDAGLLRDVTSSHLHRLSCDIGQFSAEPGLQKPHGVPKCMRAQLEREFGVADFQTAHVARVNEWERVSKGDVVIAALGNGEHVAGTAVHHVSVACFGATSVLTMLDVFEFTSRPHARCSSHVRGGAGMWVFTSQIECACIWSESAGSVRILRTVHVDPVWPTECR